MSEYVMLASSALQLAGGVRSGMMAQKGAEASAQKLEWQQQAQILQANQLEQQAAAIQRDGENTMTEADLLAQQNAASAKMNREQLRRDVSSMYAQVSKNGVRVDTGSPLLSLADAADWGANKQAMAEQSNDIQEWQKRRHALGIMDKSTITLDSAKLLKAEAPLYGWQASIARIGGNEALMGNVMSGAAGAIKTSSPLLSKGYNYGSKTATDIDG